MAKAKKKTKALVTRPPQCLYVLDGQRCASREGHRGRHKLRGPVASTPVAPRKRVQEEPTESERRIKIISDQLASEIWTIATALAREILETRLNEIMRP